MSKERFAVQSDDKRLIAGFSLEISSGAPEVRFRAVPQGEPFLAFQNRRMAKVAAALLHASTGRDFNVVLIGSENNQEESW